GLIVMLNYPWRQTRIRVVPYSDLEQTLAAHQVARGLLLDRELVDYLKTPDSQGYQMLAAQRMEIDLADRLSHYQVPFTREYSSWLQQVMVWMAPAVVL